MIFKQRTLYLLVLFGMIAVVIVALGGGLWGQQEPWIFQWQHQAFSKLCHQNPDRSFSINGQPMAVCSRCFGIYAGFLTGWLFLPFLAAINIGSSLAHKRIIGIAILINLIDLIGNMLGFWQNTLITRLVLGWLVGSTAAALFSGVFFKSKQKSEECYGRVRTSGAAK